MKLESANEVKRIIPEQKNTEEYFADLEG